MTFKLKFSRRKHDNVKFRCFICDKELSTKQKLDEHTTNKHGNEQYELDIRGGLEIESDSESSLESSETEDLLNWKNVSMF